MTTGDTPAISNYVASSNTYSPSLTGLVLDHSTTLTPVNPPILWADATGIGQPRRQAVINVVGAPYPPVPLKEKQMAEKSNQPPRRIVQVFIADTDDNIPLEKSVIYTGEQKLTDLTDQELFFEIGISDILKSHNEYRKGVVNKKVKERQEYLEPVKVRDLKMVVVDVARF